MEMLGFALAHDGWTLRSGEAEGADTAFRKGAVSAGGSVELYLPWKQFNGSDSDLYDLPKMPEAERIAGELHPNWDACSQGGKKLLARNLFQMLGKNLDDPSKIVIGWTITPGSGGTGFAFSIARKYDIPVLNLRSAEAKLDRMERKNAVAFVLDRIASMASRDIGNAKGR